MYFQGQVPQSWLDIVWKATVCLYETSLIGSVYSSTLIVLNAIICYEVPGTFLKFFNFFFHSYGSF